MKKLKFAISFLLLFISGTLVIKAQAITGVWIGKINRQKVEVKIILEGGSLTGTTYYYESPNNYRRYSIKGYFDPGTNEAVWWDDQLIEENGHGSSERRAPLLSTAYFNCPGYGRMIVCGKVSTVDHQNERAGEMNLDQTNWSNFTDEWDFVLESFTVGVDDPGSIDSVEPIAAAKKAFGGKPVKPFREAEPIISIPGSTPTQIEFPTPESTTTVWPAESIKPSSIEQKYTARKKVFATEIPVSGDSVELHFYDNAQVDGDSISLFLNDKLIFEHIRLTGKPYSVKLAVMELNSSNELIMVAENLGSIPPNTSYMVVTVGDTTYKARLESTEGSSALIRLVKPTDGRRPSLIGSVCNVIVRNLLSRFLNKE